MEKVFTEELQLQDGRTLYLTFHQANDEDMAEYLNWCKENYAGDENMTGSLRLLYAQAEYDFAVNNDSEKAVNDLLSGLSKHDEKQVKNTPDILAYIDTASLLAEILLRLGRTDEALVWSEKVYNLASDNLPGTVEIAYAQELYACCLYAAGKIEDAKEMFTDALVDIEYEITEAKNLKSGIIANLDELR